MTSSAFGICAVLAALSTRHLRARFSVDVVDALYASTPAHFVAAILNIFALASQAGEDNLDLQNSWRETDTTVPVEPRSGPGVITIKYRIPAVLSCPSCLR